MEKRKQEAGLAPFSSGELFFFSNFYKCSYS